MLLNPGGTGADNAPPEAGAWLWAEGLVNKSAVKGIWVSTRVCVDPYLTLWRSGITRQTQLSGDYQQRVRRARALEDNFLEEAVINAGIESRVAERKAIIDPEPPLG